MSSDDNQDKKYPSQTEILKDWPVLETLDFRGVTIDVTQWEDSEYTATLNFHMPGEEPPFSGYSLCTQIAGDSLEEVWERIELLLASGLLDGIDVASRGTIWGTEGEELGEVDWSQWGDHWGNEEEIEVKLEDDEDKPVLH